MFDAFVFSALIAIAIIHVIFFIKLKMMDDALERYFDFEIDRLRKEKLHELQEIGSFKTDDLVIILKKKDRE